MTLTRRDTGKQRAWDVEYCRCGLHTFIALHAYWICTFVFAAITLRSTSVLAALAPRAIQFTALIMAATYAYVNGQSTVRALRAIMVFEYAFAMIAAGPLLAEVCARRLYSAQGNMQLWIMSIQYFIHDVAILVVPPLFVHCWLRSLQRLRTAKEHHVSLGVRDVRLPQLALLSLSAIGLGVFQVAFANAFCLQQLRGAISPQRSLAHVVWVVYTLASVAGPCMCVYAACAPMRSLRSLTVGLRHIQLLEAVRVAIVFASAYTYFSLNTSHALYGSAKLAATQASVLSFYALPTICVLSRWTTVLLRANDVLWESYVQCCRQCGYPIGGHCDRCTECGAVLTASS